MKSGLEGRNNQVMSWSDSYVLSPVSMKSGLEGRNNTCMRTTTGHNLRSLNEVRPRRPEQ